MNRLNATQMAIGLAMILWGLVVVPVVPHAMLDVVLSPDELRDAELTTETLRKLSQVLSLERWAWAGAGALVAGIGALGLIRGRQV